MQITNLRQFSELLPSLLDQGFIGSISIEFKSIKTDLRRILDTALWPSAVEPKYIIRDEAGKIARARSIITNVIQNINGKKFLDFGCGEGHTIYAAKENNAALVRGFDIQHTGQWPQECTLNWEKIIKDGPYDIILLYDVLDHAIPDQTTIFDKIKQVATKDTIIYVRCHPYTAIHGGHQYYSFNKGYAHMITNLIIDGYYIPMHEQFPIQVHRPLATYKNWFDDAGLTIKEISVVQSDINPFFTQQPIFGILKSIWESQSRQTIDDDTYQRIMRIEFIDYIINL